MDQLTHTLEVKLNLFLRAFIKFYDLKAPYGLNTCKLFWGTLGMITIPPVMLAVSPILLLIVGAAWLDDKANSARAAKRRAYYALSREERYALDNPPPKPKSSRAEKLEKFSAWASAVWFKIAMPVTWLFRFSVGVAVLVGAWFLAHLLIDAAESAPWESILPIAGLSLLGAALLTGIGYLAINGYLAWREKHPKKIKPKKAKKPSVIKAVFASIHNHTCANVEVKS